MNVTTTSALSDPCGYDGVSSNNQPMKTWSVQTFNTDTKQWENLHGYPRINKQQQAVKLCQHYIDSWEGKAYRVVINHTN